MKKYFTLITFIFSFSVFCQSGTLDTSFNSSDQGYGFGDGLNNTNRTIVIQPDGKIIIGGSFTLFNGITKNRIIRLNIDGTIDNSFEIGVGADNVINSIVIQNDGKIVIAGLFTKFNTISLNKIARLNSDGSIDNQFNPGTGANDKINVISLQSDNKILIGGAFTSFNGQVSNRIARLNSDGSLDSNFNSNSGPDDEVNTILIQNDNKIIIGGLFLEYSNTIVNRIVRLNNDGTQDNTFNTGIGFNKGVNSIVKLSNNKLIIGGSFTNYNGTNYNRIICLESDGSLDSTFNSGTGANNTINQIAIQDSTKLILTGSFTSYNGSIGLNRIARIDSNGLLDSTFNSGSGANNSINSICIDNDSKIIIGGGFDNFNSLVIKRIARLNNDGSIDENFNNGYGANGLIRSIVVQQDDKIIIGGAFTNYNQTSSNRISRLTVDGSKDSTFNFGTGFNNSVNVIVVQQDGKIIVGGNFTKYNNIVTNRLIRLNSNGSIDTSFNIGLGANNTIYSLSLQNDGKIIISGTFTQYNNLIANRIARINSDGSLDSSFNTGTGANNVVYINKILSDGKIIIGGNFTNFNGLSRNRLIKLNSDGSEDLAFNFGGGTDSVIYTLDQGIDGKIVIGGSFTLVNGISKNRICTINNNGSLDLSFNIGSGFNNSVIKTIIQPDGKMLIGGNFTTYNGLSKNRILRLNNDGSIDNTFVTGTGLNSSLSEIEILNNGDYMIGGNFTAYDGIGRNRIARLFNDNNLNVSNFESIQRIKIYPVPTNNFLNVEGLREINSQVTVYDMFGKTINNYVLIDKKIDLTNLSQGIYLLSIKDSDGTTIRKKIIKN